MISFIILLFQPIQWYTPSGKLVEERNINNKRVFVEQRESGTLAVLIMHNIKISDGGNWTCKSGELQETREFIVGGMKLFTLIKNIGTTELISMKFRRFLLSTAFNNQLLDIARTLERKLGYDIRVGIGFVSTSGRVPDVLITAVLGSIPSQAQRHIVWF